MKKVRLFFSFLLPCFLLFQAEQAFAKEVSSVVVLAFGDSITQGLARRYGDEGEVIRWGILEPPMGFPTTSWGYPIELDKIIEAELPAFLNSSDRIPATVHNWGHMGFTSRDMLDCQENPKNCIDTVLAVHSNADFILVLLGANDIYNSTIDQLETKWNLEQIIDKCRDTGIEPILGTLTPITDRHAPFRAVVVDRDYNPEIRALAEEKSVLLADHYLAMENDWIDLYTSGDGLHLSRPGNKKLARSWYETLIKSTQFKNLPLNPIYFLLLGE